MTLIIFPQLSSRCHTDSWKSKEIHREEQDNWSSQEFRLIAKVNGKKIEGKTALN